MYYTFCCFERLCKWPHGVGYYALNGEARVLLLLVLLVLLLLVLVLLVLPLLVLPLLPLLPLLLFSKRPSSMSSCSNLSMNWGSW